MNVDAFLNELQASPEYSDQIVHVHEVPARSGEFVEFDFVTNPHLQALKISLGIERLYSHQAEAIEAVRCGDNVLVATGTASGKTLCYTVPIIEALASDPQARALLLFPTKALCQDQFGKFLPLLEAAGLGDRLAGVYDGDTPSTLRRKLRDRASVVFSNPDMVHSALMPQHARWAHFLGDLKLLIIDELHVYSGIFGSNMTHVLTRFSRVCRHYGSEPLIIACSATIANPTELAGALAGRTFHLVNHDGSPRGRKFYVLWNPPRVRPGSWRSRRSANVEAHEIMARLVAAGIPTITFSKARMTAEMIHRYVTEKLRDTAPHRAAKVTPYRGGYLPAERREIEKKLFGGELLGVSTTRALELGIDVGTIEASIIVGYPGTRASFFQQAGRAGRKAADSVVFLIGLDTSINQYIMTNPAYIFEECIESAVIDPGNPFVATGHLRCATHEIPLKDAEKDAFGPHADMILRVLNDNQKVHRIGSQWYHASSETPQYEVSLRNYSDGNVLIEDVDTGEMIGEVDRFDAEPILHPEAIYMHRGDTYRVLRLDLDHNVASVKRVEVDYYTQPLGGTDIHHIDNQLREKAFGTGKVCWGEVTAYFRTHAYEKIHFYSLDAISVHDLELPTMVLETLAFWIVPPDDVLERVRLAGLDAHSGLRAVGYATRMLLPLFMTCDTLDFSHTVGSVNSPWQAVFIYERYPHGLGFTGKAYELMDQILPRVQENVASCPCAAGCPCCVGKPLRQYATWNVERGEASIPCKQSALMILDGLLGDGNGLTQPDKQALTDSGSAGALRLEQALRRRLERPREPQVFHPIRPQSEVRTAYPDVERPETLATPDVAKRNERRRSFDRDLHKKLAKRIKLDGLDPFSGGEGPPKGMKTRSSNLRPTDFAGRPAEASSSPPPPAPAPAPEPPSPPEPASTVKLGDSLASRAMKRVKKRNR